MSTKYPQGVITATPPFQSTTAQSFSGVWTLEQLGKNYFYYQQPVAKSLRFRSSATAYLNRTPSTGGNRTTWTWSAWVKRGALGANRTMLGAGSASNQIFFLSFGSDDKLYIHNGVQGTSTESWAVTSQVFRDPSAWYHIVLDMDTTNATAIDRVKLYVNGTQSTLNNNSTNYYPSQNYATAINNTVSTTIGFGFDNASTSYTDGYLAEINFIDGQALDPSYFGQLSTITGVWAPKKYVGSYGGNGFYLPFTDATSTTTLGYDSSGNGNNWTTNNISLTSGSTYDSMWDSPTSYDNGGNGVGNYAVLNPLDKSSNITTSDGNLAISCSTASHNLTRATIALPSSGKFYAEMTFGSTMTGNPAAAFALLAANAGVTSHPVAAGNYCVYGSANTTLNSGATTGAAVTGMTTGQVWQFAVDVDGGNAWIGLNNSWYNVYTSGATTGNPSTGANPTFSGGSFAGMFFGADLVNTSAIINLGQRPFAYTPPTGFKALNTQNLPAVSIANGANHMAATTYTGNGGTQSIINAANSVSFQPDLVWIKQRNIARDNQLQDVIRGVGKELQSNTTGAETTYGLVSSFNSNGFSVYTNGTYLASNESGGTYVAWQWKAGGTAVTNTAGSITSSVSANPTAGFSVVTFAANGVAGATIGHGIGVAPKFMILKSRNLVQSWAVYHDSLGVNGYLWLDQTAAAGSASTPWNSTAPSSTVFTLGSGFTSAGWGNMVAYCWAAIAGYSAFGSYTGNGSVSGPFIYTGFRPAFLLVKCSSATESWYIGDHSRPNYNGTPGTTGPMCYIQPNSSNAESNNGWYQFYANGFSMNYPGADTNVSGNTYIYAAFAENPFKYSLAR